MKQIFEDGIYNDVKEDRKFEDLPVHDPFKQANLTDNESDDEMEAPDKKKKFT